MTQAETGLDYDILIVGGGMVGASLACALGQYQMQSQEKAQSKSIKPLRIGVVEATPFSSEAQPSFDARTVALAEGSKQIFAALNLWQAMEEGGVMPIKRIHVSDRGHIGSTHMDCKDQHVDAFGYVVETRVMGEVLNNAMGKLDNVELICPAEVIGLDVSASAATITVNNAGQERQLRAQLVVAADGGQSFVREQAGIKTFTLNYDQSAAIANVACDKTHDNIAYERFTDNGPMALLPTCNRDTGDNNMYALVWTVKPGAVKQIAELDDPAFLSQLQQAFGKRAGNFIKTGPRHVYPLRFLQTREHVRPHLAIIGNAAHALHPVSGQGFNLGLRDVAVLAQVLVDGLRDGKPVDDIDVLREYAQWRRRDQLTTAFSTDSLVRIFSNNFKPLALARNIALLAMDILPPLKKRLARHAMGYTGKLPRLARGLPL
ncbi:MAG: 2-octaprenyl-6-methoxyphenyl hydroxylase [Gammaproteobacteria bacterium]|nr:2-octaprenyl-6-methoxyphenyl hydroxylase [Gammaproteobacteria bacterium]